MVKRVDKAPNSCYNDYADRASARRTLFLHAGMAELADARDLKSRDT